MIFFILYLADTHIFTKKSSSKQDIIEFYDLSYFEIIFALLNEIIIVYM